MEIQDVFKGAESALTAGRVFGQPYEKDGITIIPTAALRAGGGGGRSEQATERGGPGTGGGFGVMAKPIGAYVIKDGRVSWRPVIDVNRLLTITGALCAAALFAVGMGRRPKRTSFLPKVAARAGVILRLGSKATSWR